MQKTARFNLILIPLALLALVEPPGCGSSSSTAILGPIDGTFLVTGWICGSTDILGALSGQGATQVKAIIANTSTTIAISLGSSCTQTSADSSSYPAAASITLTEGATSCSPGCTSQCTPKAASNRIDTYAYSEGGSMLTFDRVLTSSDVSSGSLQAAVGCSTGQTESLTLIKQ